MQPGQSESGGRYPVSNVVYNAATLMHFRGKELEVLDEYERDAQSGNHQELVKIIQTMRKQSQDVLQQLEGVLARNAK